MSPRSRLLVENQAADLDTLSSWRVCWSVGVREGSVWRPHSDTVLAHRHALTVAVEALQEYDFLRSHVFLVVELVPLTRGDSHSLALDLVADGRSVAVWAWQHFLAAVVNISVILALRVHEVCGDEVFVLGGTPVYHGQWGV